jgi:hypothetical protein
MLSQGQRAEIYVVIVGEQKEELHAPLTKNEGGRKKKELGNQTKIGKTYRKQHMVRSVGGAGPAFYI